MEHGTMEPSAELRTYYNTRWAAGHEVTPYALIRLSKILSLLAMESAPRQICDLGCGTGLTSGLLGVLYEVCGVDLADTSRQQELFPTCTFVTADILDWDHPKQTYDAVISQEVLEHIPYDRQADYLAVARNLLKPDGALILTTPNAPTMNAIDGGGRTWSNQPIEDWVTKSQLVNLLTSSGFEARQINTIIPGVGRKGIYRLINSAKLRALVRAGGLENALDDALCRLGFGLNLAVLARKV